MRVIAQRGGSLDPTLRMFVMALPRKPAKGAKKSPRNAEGAAGKRGGPAAAPARAGRNPAKGAAVKGGRRSDGAAGKRGAEGRAAGGGRRGEGQKGGFVRKAHVVARASRDAKIIKAEAGMTLGAWVAMESGGTMSVREAKRLLETGICKINGIVETFASRVLKENEAIDLRLPATMAPARRLARVEPERIIYDDDAIVIYDKPADLPVTPPDSGRGPSLLGLLKEKWQNLRPVHRIDADTSGLVIFAKTHEAEKILIEAFKAHDVDKRYLALVRGHPKQEGTHRSYLVKVASGRGFEKWVSHSQSDGSSQPGREAITHWTLEDRVGYWGALVEVRPETGRHHQIRIHMAELGHPLIGDVRYGDRKDPIVVGRHLLHAASIIFKHPISGQELAFRARLPEDFRAAMDDLKRV